MGLLDNPQDAALMQLGLGLLSAGGPSRSPVSLGQAIGSAGQGAMEEYRRTQALQQQMAQRKMQEQMQQMQLSQHQMTLDESTRRNAALKLFRDQLPAELQGRFDVDPQGFLKAMSKDQEEYTLTPGAARFKGDKQIAAVPSAEKAAPTPIQEYQFAVGQGYKGSYDQWDRSRRQAGATSIQNYPSPMVAINPATGKPEYVQFGNKGGALPTGFTPPAEKPPVGFRYAPSGDLEAVPGGPADVKSQAQAQLKATGAADVDAAVGTLRDAYGRLEKGGGITSTKGNALSNMTAAASSSALGQAVGKTLGTQNQSARNDIAMTRPALLAALMKATGMSAKQMDSNAELKLWLATATDPTLDVESNRRALDAIERKYLQPQQQGRQPQGRQEVRRGKYNGKTVIQYSDGSIENAD